MAAKSNVAAEITFDGSTLIADVPGFDGAFTALTIARSNPVNLFFRNASGHDARFVLEAFPNPDSSNPGPARYCTALVEPGGVQTVTVRLGQSSAQIIAAGNPGYSFVVPGSDAALEVIVP